MWLYKMTSKAEEGYMYMHLVGRWRHVENSKDRALQSQITSYDTTQGFTFQFGGRNQRVAITPIKINRFVCWIIYSSSIKHARRQHNITKRMDNRHLTIMRFTESSE